MIEDRLHALISDIYEAVTQPELPAQVLKDAATLTGSSAATLDIANGDGVLNQVIYGADPAFRSVANELWDQNLFAQRRHRLVPGKATFGRHLASIDEIRGTAFLHEFLMPARTVHLLCLAFVADASWCGGLSLWRSMSAEPHGETERDLGNVLAWHLRRAFQVGVHVREAAAKGRTMEAVVDRLSSGCILIDGGGRLVHANRQAMQILSEGTTLTVSGGWVRPVASADRPRWGLLLDRLSPERGPPSGTAAALEGASDPLILHAVPLRASTAEIWGVPRLDTALGLVIMLPQSRQPLSHEELLTTAFGLTPAEAALAAALAEGDTLRNCAERRQRSLNTVKTHLTASSPEDGG